MSAAKKRSRFGYLSEATQTAPGDSTEDAPRTGASGSRAPDETDGREAAGGSGGEGSGFPRRRRRTSKNPARRASVQELVSVPKGKGRMKQERSQLNVRVPTTLKRKASAKAVLEGKDIGEVVEALLREYLER